MTRRRDGDEQKALEAFLHAQQRQQQPVINGKYNITATCIWCIIYIYIYIHKYYIRVHHDWQVSSAKRIRLISKPPVPILLVFTPVRDLIASLGTRARTLADDTLLLLLLLLRNWLEKVFWKPVKLSVYCIYIYIYIRTYGVICQREQYHRSALGAASVVYCVVQTCLYIIFDLYILIQIYYNMYIIVVEQHQFTTPTLEIDRLHYTSSTSTHPPIATTINPRHEYALLTLSIIYILLEKMQKHMIMVPILGGQYV